MREAASQILLERARQGDGLQRPLLVSLVIHLAVVAASLLSPPPWLDAMEPESSVMTVRLGGPQGPGEGGLTPIGSRPIQEVIPLQEARRPQWIQPPADTAPDVVVPVEEAPRAEPPSEVQTAPDEARGRQLTRGPQLREGTAMADTGVEGMGVGLSSGRARRKQYRAEPV